MAEIQVRAAVSPDFSILTAFDHSIRTERVWQLDHYGENGNESVNFREIRLPRPIRVEYPYPSGSLLERSKLLSIVLLACMEDVPIGYIGITTNQAVSNTWIKELVVHERWRRRGFASALIKASHDWSLERGIQRISLEMSSKNFPAIALARKLSFEFCGYDEYYYPNNDIALFFVKFLRK